MSYWKIILIIKTLIYEQMHEHVCVQSDIPVIRKRLRKSKCLLTSPYIKLSPADLISNINHDSTIFKHKQKIERNQWKTVNTENQFNAHEYFSLNQSLPESDGRRSWVSVRCLYSPSCCSVNTINLMMWYSYNVLSLQKSKTLDLEHEQSSLHIWL